jgi:hypothetical protein
VVSPVLVAALIWAAAKVASSCGASSTTRTRAACYAYGSGELLAIRRRPPPRFDDLAELRVSELRYDSTRSGKELEPLKGFEHVCDDQVCIGTRIVRYEPPGCFHVFDRLGRPSKLGHPSKRSLTSSWGTAFPSFACFKPRSTF